MLFDLNNSNPAQTILTLTFKREKNKSTPCLEVFVCWEKRSYNKGEHR